MSTPCIYADAEALVETVCSDFSVQELHLWLTVTLHEHSVATTVQAYLLTRGGITMAIFLNGTDGDLRTYLS